MRTRFGTTQRTTRPLDGERCVQAQRGARGAWLRGLLLVALAGSLLAGCRAPSLGRGEQGFVLYEGAATNTVFAPAVRTAVYAFRDPNTADFVLSSWTVEDLRAFGEGRLPLEPGAMTHVHVFLMPRAGQTPVDFTANNVNVSMLVLAGRQAEAAGHYGGGGFLLPGDRLGEAEVTGVVRDATIRLIGRSAHYEDLLGPTLMSGTIRAFRDEERADAMLDWMRAMVRNRAPDEPPAVSEAGSTPQ